MEDIVAFLFAEKSKDWQLGGKVVIKLRSGVNAHCGPSYAALAKSEESDVTDRPRKLLRFTSVLLGQQVLETANLFREIIVQSILQLVTHDVVRYVQTVTTCFHSV